MATMVPDGNGRISSLKKSLDALARRHHVRMWWRTRNTESESVWLLPLLKTLESGFPHGH
jgi:hypothetical protein